MKKLQLSIASIMAAGLMVSNVALAADEAPAADSAPAPAAAQVKIAVIDLQEIIEKSPNIEKVNSDIEKKFKPREEKIVDMQNKLKEQIETLQRDAAVMSEEKLNQAQDKIVAERASLQAMQETFRQDLRMAQSQAYRKFISQVNSIVEGIAKDQQYTLVLQREGIPYVAPSADITEQVIKTMNKK